jgi:uncharacterized protein YoaH (UPF0181 family)
MLPAIVRRGVYVPKVAVMALSTQTEAAVEAALSKAHWTDVKDVVKEINHLMREGTTNHSVELPSPKLEQQVDEKFRGIQRLVENKKRNEAFSQLHTLKCMVKDELYHHRQRAAFSTVTDDDIYDFEGAMRKLQWSDVKDEVEEIRKLMHEGTTNHAVDTPDVELELLVDRSINDIKQMVEKNPSNHELVFARIHGLKSFVKAKLYDGPPADDHVKAFERFMHSLHWSDVKDEVEEIHQLMQEGTTNHAVALPDASLKRLVDDSLREIESMMKNDPTAVDHAKIFDRVRKLKLDVKAELYN